MHQLKVAIILATAVLLSAPPALTAASNPVKAGRNDKCPVCGMFVAKYPDFAAHIRLRDGSRLFFDGAKDMFRFYLSPSRYLPARTPTDITGAVVTSYYDLLPTNAMDAWYVIGSDVFGPMGHELIPFARETEAREFMKDHKGKRILRFRDVTTAILSELK